MKANIFIVIAIGLVLVSAYFLYHQQASTEAQGDQVIYVSPEGSDKDAGTKSRPIRTLKKAANMAAAGTTVYVREGTYNETLTIQHNGTKAQPITFKAYKKEPVIISGSHLENLEEDTALINLINKHYITIQGFTVEDLSTSQNNPTVMGIYIAGNSSHITIKQNQVRAIETKAEAGNAHGIAVYGTDRIRDINIIENTVEELTLGASEALVLNGNVDGFTISGNLVRKNNNIGIDLIGYEGTSKQKDYVRNGVVEGNTVAYNSSFENPVYGEDYSAGGIYVDGGQNITIRKNTVHHNDIGIEATSEHYGKSASNISILQNKVYKNTYTGISIGGYDKQRGRTEHSTIAHNTLYDNDTKGLEGGQLLLQYHVNHNRIEKNTVTAGPSGLLLVQIDPNNKKNTLAENIYKANKQQGKWIWNEQEYTDFPAYQQASGQDQNSNFTE